MSKVIKWYRGIIGVFLIALVTGLVSQAQSNPLITTIEVSPDGSKIIGAGNDFLRVWDSATGQVLVDLEPYISGFFVLDVSWNPESTRFATASDSEMVQIWSAGETNVPIGTLLAEITPPYHGLSLVSSVEWSPDSQLLAIGIFNQAPGLQIWSATTYELLEEFPALIEVEDIDWHPQSQNLLASVSAYGGVRIWNINNPTETPPLVCNTCPYNPEALDSAVAWSNDGTRLAIGSSDGRVIVVNYTSDTAITTFETGDWVLDLVWSSDDQYILTANNAADVQIWDSFTGESLGTIAYNSYAVGFNPLNQVVIYTDNLDTSFSNISTPLSDIIQLCDMTVATADSAALVNTIINANSAGSAQTLCLEGTYTLTAANNSSSDGANGLPVITGDITLYGMGTDASIIRDSNAPAFRILKVETGAHLSLNNLTIAQGNAGSTQSGGGIRNLGTLDVLNSTIRDNTASSGGGIRNNNNATLSISNSLFQNNIAIGSGGAIYSNVGSSTSISNSQFLNNQANLNTDGGGALLMNGASLSIDGSHFEGNTSRNGAALLILQVTGANPAQISNSEFLNNQAQNQGGAIHLYAGTANFENLSFTGNTAISHGGAIRNVGNLTISNSNFSNNYGGNSGGGAISNAGSLTIDNSQFVGNSISSTSGLGGTIFNESSLSFSNSSITGGTVSGNHARHGGALYSSLGTNTLSNVSINGLSALLNGGAIRIDGSASLSAVGLSLSNNIADYGGALANNTGTIQFSNGYLQNNQARVRGGAIDTSQITNSFLHYNCIEGNTAPSSSAIYSNVQSFDAANNWWGLVTGPSAGAVNSKLTTQPFINSDCQTAISGGGQSLLSTMSSSTSLASITLPYSSNFDEVLSLQGSGAWTLNTIAGRSGGAWVLDATIPNTQSMLITPFLLNLGNQQNPSLRFWHRGNLVSSDTVYLEVQASGGSTWTILGTYAGLNSIWTQVTVNLSAYRNQSIQLRWRFQSADAEATGSRSIDYAIDDLEVSNRR